MQSSTCQKPYEVGQALDQTFESVFSKPLCVDQWIAGIRVHARRVPSGDGSNDIRNDLTTYIQSTGGRIAVHNE